MSTLPAARVEDDIAHSEAGFGMALGIGLGILAGVALVGATIATGGAALAVVAAVGGAMAATSAGGLGGMYIGEASMGPPCGKFVTGSPTVFINGKPATFTLGSTASCSKDSGAPQPLATGSSTVMINFGLAGRRDEKVACSAKSIDKVSPTVFIGGESAQDPRVQMTPEVPEWAVTGLKILGVAGMILTLPFSIATVGIAATAGGLILGAVGADLGAKGGRALGEALGLPESAIRGLEVAGGLVGGLLGGAAGTKGVQAFNERYQISVEPNTLGMNGGNIKITPREPPAAPVSEPTPSATSTGQQRGPDGRFTSSDEAPPRYNRDTEYPSGYRKGVVDKVLDDNTIKSGPNAGKVRTADGDIVDRNHPDLTIEHEKPVVEHWNETGYNSDRATRNDFYNNTDNMSLRLRGPNSSDGGKMSAAGIRYRQDPGPNYSR